MHLRSAAAALALLVVTVGQAAGGVGATSTVMTGRSAYGAVLFDGHGKAPVLGQQHPMLPRAERSEGAVRNPTRRR